MKNPLRTFLFIASFSFLILNFQNCSQDNISALDSNWLEKAPTPPPEPTPVLTKEGAQCELTETVNSKVCNSPALTFTFKDMPLDENGVPQAATLVVPQGCNVMNVKIWGAGGGGYLSTSSFRGGSGSNVFGGIRVLPGEILKVIVGEGGKPGGDQTFGGGGSSSFVNGFSAGGASGGGRSAIMRGYYDIVSAGGGGGASSQGHGGSSGKTKNGDGDKSSCSVSSCSAVANGGGGAANGDSIYVAKEGTAGTFVPSSTQKASDGIKGNRFQGGNAGSGKPGGGGGGGGYFGGGGGASSGEQNPAATFNYAGAGGAGGNYVGCGNLTVKGVDERSSSVKSTNDPEAIYGYNAPPLVGFGCATPSRGGGAIPLNFGSKFTCNGSSDLRGSDGLVYIQWSAQ